MNKVVSLMASAVIGIGAATAVAYAVVNGATAAPSTNPASGQLIQYGDRGVAR